MIYSITDPHLFLMMGLAECPVVGLRRDS